MGKKEKNKYSQYIIIVIVCFIAELIISNFMSLSVIFGNVEKKEMDIASDLKVSGEKIKYKDSDGVYQEENYLSFKNVNTKIKSVCITLTDEYYEYVDVDVSFSDDNFAYEDAFGYNKLSTRMFTGTSEKNFFSVNSFGDVKELRIEFGESTGDIEIDSITVNDTPDFRFSLFRYLFMAAACVIVLNGYWQIKFGKKNELILKFAAGVMCIAVVTVGLMITDTSDYTFLDDYPSQNITDEDQYRQLFEAFKKGQLNLEIDYDVEKLDSLENPYDRSERNKEDLHGALWDRAYYNGKFYSYFGVAPIITVYYPINLLTGKVPTTIMVSTVLCLYAVIFISLLYIEVIKRFCKDVPLVLAVLGEAAILFGSLIFAEALEFQFYYLAVVSGIGCVAAFLYFILKAYFETEDHRKRLIYLVLTGISLVLVVASRPTLLLYCFSAIVPALFIFTNKKEEMKNKIQYLCSVGIPVVIGAVLIMVYNYKRFDSPFEFGFNYQLTVSMAKANTITLAMIPAAFYHYFIQQPGIRSTYPYFEIKSLSLSSYSRYNYNGRAMGILNYPITWGAFLLPFTTRKKDKFKTAFFMTLGGLAIVMSFIDMCKAGSHYRYTADILLPIALIGIMAMFDLLSYLKDISKKSYITFYIFIVLILLATIWVGYHMMFANETGKLMKTFALAGYKLKNL